MQRTCRRIVLLSALALASSAHADSAGESIADAITAGTAHVAVRVRYEGVDDAAFQTNASAVTVRTRLTWQSATFRDFNLVLEADDVRAPEERYDSTSNGRIGRPVVADPTGTDINRALIEWKHGASQVDIGRQRITLDNQRFIGNSGWRQNEQTFDGLYAQTNDLHNLQLSYGFIYNVDRVYGPTDGSQRAEWHGRVQLLHARLNAGSIGDVTAFGYFLDLQNAALQSNNTYGLLWTKRLEIGDGWTFPFAASYATQSDAGGNPTAYSAYYEQVETGVSKSKWTLAVGRELLSGDATRPGHRFQTPLATLHAFQGWVDKFLVTPPQGIRDSYISLSRKTAALTTIVAWHDFRAAAVDRSYGSEWNASVGVPFASHYEALVKAGRYTARGFAADTTKLWVMLTASF